MKFIMLMRQALMTALLLSGLFVSQAKAWDAPWLSISVSPRTIGQAQVPDYHEVRAGDTLWGISDQYFGNPWEWPRVWSYNPEVTNPHWIYPDDRIRLSSTSRGAAARRSGGASNGVRKGRRVSSVLLRQQGYLDRDALRQRGIISASPEDHMLLAPTDHVYITFKGKTPRVGTEVTVFRPVELEELGSKEHGVVVKISGTARIDRYDADREVARAVVVDALEPIERGFHVAPMVRRFDRTDPVPNAKHHLAHVVASITPVTLMSEHQLVFIDVGAKNGVKEGNRFFVVRQTDAWRDSLDAPEREMGALAPSPGLKNYPKESVGELVVVHTRPATSACLVTRSTQAIVPGDRVEARAGY